MRRRGRQLIFRLLLWVFPAALFGVLPASAKVYRGLGTAWEDQVYDGSLPWQHAYKTRMTVNGRPTTLQLYCARYTEPVVEQLTARFEALGASVKVTRSSEGARGLATWPDRTASFLVLAPPSQPLKQIFVYFPEPGAVAKPVKFPVPPYPHGRVLSTISDDHTNVFMSTVDSNDSSTEVHSFYLRELTGDGWTVVMPATVSGGAVGGMAVYQKKNKICYVQSKDQVGSSNIITLLVKQGAL